MKNKMKCLILALGIVCLLLSISCLFVFNYNFGIVIISCASCLIIIYGLFYERLIKIKWLTYCILTACAATAFLMLFVYFYGKNDNTMFDEDAVIVLGAALRKERVSLILARRLDKAAEYHFKNPGAVIIVSGGQGFQEDIPEAEAMERYLINKGVPEEAIIKEDAASSTYENLLFSKEILDGLFDREYKTVIITNDFHIFRAASLAKKLGYNTTHFAAETDVYTIPMNYLRECTAIMKMWVLGR